jgi:hypothetical protein
MAHYKDWLPARRTDQLAMAKNWHTVINKNLVKWSIPSTVQDDFEVMIETAQDCLADAQSSARTAVITARCKEALLPNPASFGLRLCKPCA